MKTSRLHPSSMLVGAALAGLVVLVLGAQQVASVTRLLLQGPVTVVLPPTPDQMVHVLVGETYTVPAGKVYVATGLAPSTASSSLGVRFDGVLVGFVVTSSTIPPIPPGLSAPAGTVITTQNCTLLGYLANA